MDIGRSGRGVWWLGLGIMTLLFAGTLATLALRHSVRRAIEPVTTLPVLGQWRDFALTNQDGRLVTRTDLTGRVCLVDLIFTRCAGPCPRLTQNLVALQGELPADDRIRLVSLTADPGFDTPEILRRYAEQFGADLARWHFLTGPRDEIYRLATRDLLLVVRENPPEDRADPADLFLHSTRFVLLDGAGRLRAVFDGEDPAVRPHIRAAIDGLLNEEPASGQ